MHNLLQTLTLSERSIAILLDPEKTCTKKFSKLLRRLDAFMQAATNKIQVEQFFLFVGGSTMNGINLDQWLCDLKGETTISIVIFPGSYQQLSEYAHALLFLNLLSGRNVDYLVNQHVQAAAMLKETSLEVIPTAYLLIDGGKETAVQRVSQTKPLSQDDIETIINTAFAGQLMGNKVIYLEAGSGALKPVSTQIIKAVCEVVCVPVIVGGGLRDFKSMNKCFQAGARVVVVGTALEDKSFSF